MMLSPLFVLALQICCVFGWQLSDILPERASRIPQFIRDLDHDYIKDNYVRLNLLADPKEALCNSESLQRASLPPVPDGLFKQLFVDNNRASIKNREGWKNAKERLTEMLDCPAALGACEKFGIDIYRYHGGNWCQHSGMFGNFWPLSQCPWEPEIPPKEVPELLFEALGKMPKLESLQWENPTDEAAISVFRQALGNESKALSHIKKLTLGPNLEFLIPLAVNLKSLDTTGYAWGYFHSSWSIPPGNDSVQSRFLRATKSLRNLTHFQLSTVWTDEVVRELHSFQPGLQYLSMEGTVGLMAYMEVPHMLGRPSRPPEGHHLMQIIPSIRLFEHLQFLEFPHVIYLGMDVQEGADCGNAYFGASGTKFGRYELLAYMSATERAGRIISSQMPDLPRFCIGGYCADNTGEHLKWPWTDRVRDYLLESRPRWTEKSIDDELEDPNGPVLFSWDEDDRLLIDGELAHLFEPGRDHDDDDDVDDLSKLSLVMKYGEN